MKYINQPIASQTYRAGSKKLVIAAPKPVNRPRVQWGFSPVSRVKPSGKVYKRVKKFAVDN